MNGEPALYHSPAMPDEVMEALALKPGDSCLDATLGDGGHAQLILEATAPDGRLLALDADPEALERARQRLRSFADRVVLVNGNFAELGEIVSVKGFSPLAGALFDLGLSSWQLDRAGRGFSFSDEAPLDMRLDPQSPDTAQDLVHTLDQRELAELIWRYGEDPNARRIAQAIVQRRPIATASQLAQVIEGVVPRRGRRTHPATRTFQALRMAVNSDLENLDKALEQAVGVLRPGGRLVTLAYHSLEDRRVKEFMQREARDCICPKSIPQCVCGHKARVRILSRKVIKPSPVEVRRNPRARSARLRVCSVL